MAVSLSVVSSTNHDDSINNFVRDEANPANRPAAEEYVTFNQPEPWKTSLGLQSMRPHAEGGCKSLKGNYEVHVHLFPILLGLLSVFRAKNLTELRKINNTLTPAIWKAH